jgi:hypothetical protein
MVRKKTLTQGEESGHGMTERIRNRRNVLIWILLIPKGTPSRTN